MSEKRVEPKTPLQKRIYSVGYTITKARAADGIEAMFFEAFTPDKKPLAKSGYIAECWNACYEHLENRETFIYSLQSIFSHDTDYSANDNHNLLAQEIRRTLENLENLLEGMERMAAIERRAIHLFLNDTTPEHTRAVLVKMLGYVPDVKGTQK